MYDIAAWWHGKWSDDQLSRLAYLRDVYSLPQISSEDDNAATAEAESPVQQSS